jgi:hypothetical protein
MDYELGLLLGEEAIDVAGLSEILVLDQRDEGLNSLRAQALDDVPAEKPSSSCYNRPHGS